jgi:hypothetical protein
MAMLDEFVARIVSRARILGFSTRHDLQRELNAHFEDAMEHARGELGDRSDLAEIVCGRFGDPQEVARELGRVHRFERRAILTADASLLIGASVVAVAGLILLLQLAIAVSRGIPPSHAFPRLRGQSVAFVSLSLGYMALYLEERFLRRFRLWEAFAVNLAGFACLFALVFPLLHLRTAAPAVSFAAGALVRLLQKTPMRGFWYLGTAVPTIIAYLDAPRLLSIGGEIRPAVALLVRWIGQTAACYLLTLLARHHEKRSPSAQ